MKICIIGWYGTETIGDRAILSGLISLCNKKFSKPSFSIGSLFPFFTSRTIKEDYQKDSTIKIFNSREKKELLQEIHGSDLIIFGGGPLMHIKELYLMEYAILKAKKMEKRIVLAGCGVGPINNKKYYQPLIKIIKASSQVILRDNISLEKLKEIALKIGSDINENKIHISYDPAVQACNNFIKIDEFKIEKNNFIAVNLREFPEEYGAGKEKINQRLFEFVDKLSSKYKEKEILLIPMHYFHFGGDDRSFLNKLKLKLNKKNIFVQNDPLSLKDTMQIFSQADFCIGMRYHAVIMQTLINGRNLILDYTGLKPGKTFGFIDQIDAENFYKNYYINLQKDAAIMIPEIPKEKFSPNADLVDEKLKIYSKYL